MAPGKITRFSATDIVARARKLHEHKFHWQYADIDVLIRPRTTLESALMTQEAVKLTADIEKLAGTPDEPGLEEQARLRLRYALPCIYDTDGGEMWAEGDVEELLNLPMPALGELLDEVERVAGLTATQAEDIAKNSAPTTVGKSSLTSPDTAETSASSPTPISSPD